MRTEDKVMNNGKLQAKQEKLKSLHCPSPQSSLFDSRGSSLNTQLLSLSSHSPVPNPHQGAKSPTFGSQHNSKYAIPSPQNSDESAIRCSQYKSKCVTRCVQHSDELATSSPQNLFIDVSTELLRRGQSVRFRAPGLSMHPAIKEGEKITVVPISSFDIKRGDILLYVVGKKVIAHRVVSIKSEKNDSQSHSSANFSIQSTSHPAASLSTQSSTQSPSHSLASFATRIKTQSTAHSTANASTHSSTQASIHSKELNPQLIFILRGDASLTCDDPVEAQQVLGKVVSVEKNGRSISLYSRKVKMFHFAYTWASRLKRRIIRIFPWVRGLKLFLRPERENGAKIVRNKDLSPLILGGLR